LYLSFSLSFDFLKTYKLKRETKKSRSESRAEDKTAKLQVKIQVTSFIKTKEILAIFASIIDFCILFI
jgi:hypothetical protein